MGIFSRKKVEAAPETRSIKLGGLLYNQISNFTNSQAMKLSAVYCATNQISNAVAMLPINIVKYDSEQKRPIEHPLWKVLNISPDEKYNHFGVFKMAIESVILRGNAYFIIERDNKLDVKALHYIAADYVTPMLQQDGTVKYNVAGMSSLVEAQDMIHLWQHIDENFNGISTLRYAYNCLVSASNAESAADKFFKGGAGLNGILKAAATLTDEQKKQIRESWNQAFSNEGNGIAVLPQGLDFQAVSVNPEDAQLLESREFSVTEIARFFNISPIKLFQLNEVSYSSMESTELYFLQDTIAPYVQMLVEEFNRKLFKPSDIGKIGVEFDYTSSLRTNRQAEAEYYRTMLTNGVMSINEIRGKLGLPKIDDVSGNAHFMQISYGTAEDIASGKYLKQNSQDQNVKLDNKVSG